jgi:hypothetical protein
MQKILRPEIDRAAVRGRDGQPVVTHFAEKNPIANRA